MVDQQCMFQRAMTTIPFTSGRISWLLHTWPVQGAVRLALALVYIIAGTGKLLDVRGFAELVNLYGIVPLELLPVVALLLPIAEVGAGIGLLFRQQWALNAITAMTVLFMVILGYAIWSGLSIGDCGCFAPGDIPTGHDDGSALRAAFGRDVLLLVASVLLYFGQRRGAASIAQQS